MNRKSFRLIDRAGGDEEDSTKNKKRTKYNVEKTDKLI
jgi:hypothetical protein